MAYRLLKPLLLILLLTSWVGPAFAHSDPTSITGALINSSEGKLGLSTGKLKLAHLKDSDRYDHKSGGVSASTGALPSVTFDIIEENKQGITRATIGAGSITIRDVSRDEADALLDLANRDPAKFQQILVDEYNRTVGELDFEAIKNLPKNIAIITNALRAFATPIPAHVKSRGPVYEKYFRKLIFHGADATKAKELLDSPEVQNAIRIEQNYNEALSYYGSSWAIPEHVRAAIASGQDININKNGEPVIAGCGTISGPGCELRFAGADPQLIVARAEAEIRKIVPEMKALLSKPDLTDEERIQLALLEQNLLAQSAYYALCSELPSDLQHSGLLSSLPGHQRYINIATDYRYGGDEVAAKLETVDWQQLRHTNPAQYRAYYNLRFSHNAPLIDSAYLLAGLDNVSGLTGQDRQNIVRIAANRLAVDYFNFLGGSGRFEEIRYIIRESSDALTDLEREIFEASMSERGRIYKERLIGADRNAKIATLALIAGASAIRYTPRIIACLENLVCRNEAGIAVAEVLAGDALGGSPLSTLIARGGAVAAKFGDNVRDALRRVADGSVDGGLNRTISSPLPNGEPGAIWRGFGDLSKRQQGLLDQLGKPGDTIIIPKKGISQKDLAALTAKTGDEFAVFTTGGRRMVVRGGSNNFGGIIDEAWATQKAAQGWRFSAHTHPIPEGVDPRVVMRSSGGDRAILNIFGNQNSAIMGSNGARTLFDSAGDW